jgi:hypothetical protein
MSTPNDNPSATSQPPEVAAHSGQDKQLIEAEKDALTGKDPAADVLATELDAAERYKIATQKFEADIKKLNAQVEALEIANETSKRESREGGETHELRKAYTKYLFTVTIAWLTSVLVFVILTGLKVNIKFPVFVGRLFYYQEIRLNPASDCANCWLLYFSLSEKTLIAFITSTTASVIGIFIIVAKWLFPLKVEGKKE